MHSTNPPLFERMTRLLDPLDPAELHGLLCGLLCADAHLDCDRWIRRAREVLAEDGEFSQPVADLLAKLFEYGIAQLNAPDWTATPLLPDDDAPLSQRVDALGAWCQGLLLGLGLSQVEWDGVLSEESREFLRDATEIGRAGLDSAESSEVDETAYAELVEYLRVGLFTIHQDLGHSATPNPARVH